MSVRAACAAGARCEQHAQTPQNQLEVQRSTFKGGERGERTACWPFSSTAIAILCELPDQIAPPQQHCPQSARLTPETHRKPIPE